MRPKVELSNAEVQNYDTEFPTSPSDEIDIFWFQIAVNDVTFMRRIHCVGNLPENLNGLFQSEFPSLLEQRLQAHAIEIFHDIIVAAIVEATDAEVALLPTLPATFGS